MSLVERRWPYHRIEGYVFEDTMVAHYRGAQGDIGSECIVLLNRLPPANVTAITREGNRGYRQVRKYLNSAHMSVLLVIPILVALLLL